MCKKANFYARFDMYSRSLKATAKVQGASIISLLQNQYGESGLFKVILVKIRKTCNPLVVFRPFSLLCDVRFVNSISNLPLVSLKKSRICRSILCDELFEAKKDKAKSVLLKGTTRGTL